jgi:bacterioferritin-associated ferredoxin
MIVCVCHNVSTGDIASEAARCCSFETLQERLQVGQGCGVCVPCAKETFHEHKARQAAVVEAPRRRASSGSFALA